MLCIVMREDEGQKGSWIGRRSGELLGFHRQKQKVEILFFLYIYNTIKNNSLYFLHPGNINYCVLATEWPFPKHPDESTSNNLLKTIYGKAFELKKDKLYQTYGLSAWDSWFNVSEEPVYRPDNIVIERVFPDSKIKGFVPFTVFKAGPFKEEGAYLLCLHMRLESESYIELVTRDPFFTIDGPQMLLMRIQQQYFKKIENRSMWEQQLLLFHDYLKFGESYDIFLLTNKKVDAVEIQQKIGISQASLQPPSNNAVRFTTSNTNFNIILNYLNYPVDNKSLMEYYKRNFERV